MGRYDEKDIEFVKRLLGDRKSLGNREVEEWLSHRKNRELLDDVAFLRFHSTQVDFDEESEYLRLKRILSGRVLRARLMRLGIAASILLMVGMAGFYLWSGKTVEKGGMMEVVRASNNQVELILATGERVALMGKNNLIEGERENGIREDSLVGLDYSSANMVGSEEVFNTLKTPLGGFYALQLSDSTKVWVNSLTTLRFPVTFVGKVRKVYLEGEAYFDVAHRDSLPFIVVTSKLEVKVYGTEFNINTYEAERIKVVLVDGLVGVRVPALNREVGMHPNQLAEYAENMKDVHISEVNPFDHIAWRNGEFVFNEETVEEIMERLARWYDIQVFYINDAVRKQTFSGIINRFEHVEDVLRLISEVAIVRFEIKGNSVLVKPVK
ncbi:MAG: FecR family protein [Odoribacter sp.]|nr:FecR family protein [Odoribacter sp.]